MTASHHRGKKQEGNKGMSGAGQTKGSLQSTWMLHLPTHLVAGLSCFILPLLVAVNSRTVETGAKSGMAFLMVLILLQGYTQPQNSFCLTQITRQIPDEEIVTVFWLFG